MPKNRAYTGKELESLRRADLQSLYKIHGLKGANQKSDILIQGLLDHFKTTTFIMPSHQSSRASTSESRRVTPLGLSTSRIPVKRVGKVISRVNSPRKGIVKGKGVLPPPKEVLVGVEETPIPVVEADLPPTPASASLEVDVYAQMHVLSGRIANLESQPSSSTSTLPDLAALRTELQKMNERIQAAPSNISESRVVELLNQRDAAWEARLLAIEEVWEERLKRAEEAFEGSLQRLVGSLDSSLEGRLTRHDKRPWSPSQVVYANENSVASVSSPRKKARIDPPDVVEDEGDSRVSSEPHTPRQPAPMIIFKTPSIPMESRQPTIETILPRTPSPGHQGFMPDMSRTPRITSDYFDNDPPHHPSQPLPYPIFATTPKAPAEPRSPTGDAPPSITRGRANIGVHQMLTPGRTPGRNPKSTTRAVSDAHDELATITESPGNPTATVVAQRRVTSLDIGLSTPGLFGPSLASATSSPPRLSPSPSIGEDGFRYTPFPNNPKRLNAPATLSMHTPPKRTKSPAKEYMSVALHGLPMPSGESPGMMATPGHRTMLGTERYRDTRFGDVPVVQWSTPGVDLFGSSTPRS